MSEAGGRTAGPDREPDSPGGLRFTKMHGLGNDFVVVDALDEPVSLDPDRVRLIADRRRGVGCDQLLLLEPADEPTALCRYRVFNANGGEAEQCGNGVRCIALYLVDRGLATEELFEITGPTGPVRVERVGPERFRVDMGPPRLAPTDVPFRAEGSGAVHELTLDDGPVNVHVVSMGNPHAVLVVEELTDAAVRRLGPAIEAHERFPRGTNVGFMEVLAPDRIRLRVHERGAGETLACGTGACAAVVAGRLRGLLGERVSVSLPGGTLVIEWSGKGDTVWMTGSATSVFEGILRV